MKCLLCPSTAIEHGESVSGAALTALYRRHGITLTGAPQALQRLSCRDCGLGWFTPDYPGEPGLYEELQRGDWYYEASRPEFDFTERLARDAASVLEVGCGEGNFLARLGPQVKAVGLEFNDASLAKCKARGLNVLKMPVAEFALSNAGAFDLVCTFQVLEHVSEPLPFLDAALACLRPGGRLVVSVPNEDAPMAAMTNAWLNLPPHHLTRWQRRTFEAYGRARGLTIEDVMIDSVAPEHVKWIRDQQATNWLAGVLGMARPAIRNDLAWKAAVGGGKIVAALGGSRFDGDKGHSITVVMRKPAAAA